MAEAIELDQFFRRGNIATFILQPNIPETFYLLALEYARFASCGFQDIPNVALLV